MKTGRLRILLISILTIAATLITQSTLAFYSVTGIASNVVTSGDISVKIIEKTRDGKDFPKQGVTVYPGSIVSKTVTFKNDGGHPFWLRVKIDDGLGSTAAVAEIFDLDINTTSWIDGGDGFYYYRSIVGPGQTTQKLFSQVKIAGDSPVVLPNSTFLLNVTAYAVQSENNRASSPLKVAGWPS